MRMLASLANSSLYPQMTSGVSEVHAAPRRANGRSFTYAYASCSRALPSPKAAEPICWSTIVRFLLTVREIPVSHC